MTHVWASFQLQILPFLFLLPFLCPVFFSYLFTCFHERFFPERHRKALSAFYTHRFISVCVLEGWYVKYLGNQTVPQALLAYILL